jgi:hypothetical protein
MPPPPDSITPDYGPPWDSIIPEYGVMVASYKLSGQVVRAADPSPLDGIEITFLGSPVVSEGTGNWTLNLDNFLPCGLSGFPICSLYATDVDGPANGGEFEPTVLALQLVQTEDGGTFYFGMFEQHEIVIELNETSGE